jgi:signal transduction histidine kinase
MKAIRDLFSTHRPIDRQIEKVIDYYADDEDRLASEIEEYEATENVEACFRKFLESYRAGVQAGQVTEVGIWVAGFYGSGKSSFTKYLGFALDPERTVHGQPFLELLCDRLRSPTVRADLRAVARQLPTAVVLLDLGAEQLAESTAATVTNVLYWKVLQLAGYSKERKLATLEFNLDQRGLYDGFRVAYLEMYGEEWEKIHNDPLIGVSRASKLLPSFLPQDFPDEDSFSKLQFSMAEDVRDRARRMIEITRRYTGRENIVFMIDEAGQYVAPRGELILNLDGLARNLKELGQGRVWIMATGQQTLTEIAERAAYNTPELNKLRDRFPISIELDAKDIREITYRRLLTKSEEGAAQLRALFQSKGQALVTHTRLTGTSLYRDDPSIQDFVRYYPFLPQHFEVLIQLVRTLARSTGGIGLRSVIRVIQDVLVDTSRILPPDTPKLADRPVGKLACVDDFYVTLRADIGKILSHAVEAVDQVERVFRDSEIHLRVARAVAALQPLEEFPRTVESIAALLYPELGHTSMLEKVRQALDDLANAKEIGLIEDPKSGGYLFLSTSVRPLQTKRTEYAPTSGEVTKVRNQILQTLLEPQPATKLENIRDVRAAVRMNKTWLIGDQEEISFRLEMIPAGTWDEQRKVLMTDSAQQTEYQNVIIWLFRQDDVAEEILPEIRRSEKVVGDVDERTADRDVAQYIRAERRLARRNRERVEGLLREALLAGTFIFGGRATPVRQLGETLEAASRAKLSEVAGRVFNQYHLMKIRPKTNLAAQFLEVDRLDRMPRDRDPLQFVVQQGGMPRVDTNHPALAETLRAFKAKVDEAGGGRLTGNAVQDLFAAVPYGWSKDAVRYLFAALLVAGEVELHTGGEVLKTAGPAAVEAVKSTLAFNKVGVGLRDSKVSPEVLDRAARRLQELFGEQVLPLEDRISQAARKHLPDFVERTSALPARLRLLGLRGEGRARNLLDQLNELLKGDASDAASWVGVPDSQIPEDISWARETTRALDHDGERDIRQTVGLLNALDEIGKLFPEQRTTLASDDGIEMLQDILGSERFFEQLPDLRSTIRTMMAQVNTVYAEEWEQYWQSLQGTETALEAHPGWLLLLDEDRDAIIDRLRATLPPESPGPSPIDGLRALFVRRSGLAGLQQELEAEIKRRGATVSTPAEEIEVLKMEAGRRLDEKDAELAQAQKLTYLGIMASAMAHGLNQPIGIIRAISSASISDFHSGLLELQEAEPRFQKILAQTDRLGHIVENMRDFARGDWRKREPVDLNLVVTQMCDMFADQFRNRHIELSCSAERTEPPLLVWANPVQLQEVLINLLTNARDAVEGQSDARVQVDCWCMADGQCAFSVEDNGPGLSSEYRDQLFTPFVSTKPSEKGTGLGLFTSWRVINELDGQLRYEDGSGGGARFVVELPPLQQE